MMMRGKGVWKVLLEALDWNRTASILETSRLACLLNHRSRDENEMKGCYTIRFQAQVLRADCVATFDMVT